MIFINKIKADTTIYNHIPQLNTGFDPQLELFKYRKGEIIPTQDFEFAEWPDDTYSRILMKFDISNLNQSALKHELILHVSTLQELHSEEIELEFIQLLSDFVAGTGNRNDSPYVSNGANWETSDGQTDWIDPYYNNSIKATAILKPDSEYIQVDVTSMVNSWLADSNNIPGLVIKYTDSIEDDTRISSKIRFYGKETNSIYEPTLVSYYANPVYNGEFDPTNELEISNVDLKIKNLKTKYIKGEIITLVLQPLPEVSTKSYLTSSANNSSYMLPDDSFYRLIDTISGKIICDFHAGTAVEKSDSGYKISINTENLLPNRYYTVQFKLSNETENVIIDNNYNFRIEN